MLKIIAAAFEALFSTAAAYGITALVLFASSATLRLPGFMTARTVQRNGRLETSLAFSPYVGLVLVVVLSIVFHALHTAAANRSRGR